MVHLQVEVAAIRDLSGEAEDGRAGGRRAAAVEQIWRKKDLPDWHALIRVATLEPSVGRPRGLEWKRRVVVPDERLTVLAGEQHRTVRQQRRGAVEAARHRRPGEPRHGAGGRIEHLEEVPLP